MSTIAPPVGPSGTRPESTIARPRLGDSAISDSLRDLITGLDTLSPVELRRARAVLTAGVACANSLLDAQLPSWVRES